MTRYEYTITKHESEDFKTLVYFCSETGDCGLEEVSEDQAEKLVEILNEMGQVGWELVQISYRTDGLVAVWKRRIES